MIIDDNLSGYIKSFEPDLPEYLRNIEKSGIDNKVPIIKKDAQSILRFVLNCFKPTEILEVGTAIGFSACLMEDIMNGSSRITTIEKSEDRINDAKSNFMNSPHKNNITLLEGDAAEVLKGLVQEQYKCNMVFLDAAKAQYSEYKKSIDKLLVSGGVLLTDNILQEGSVADSKFSVTRRDRTIHMRMRSYISEVMKDENYDSCIIPVGDGMLLSVKKG